MAHLSTGEILRSEAAHGSPVGKEAARIMAAGDLVPDDLIDRIVESRLRRIEPGTSVLLDGFPRTIKQAQALEAGVGKGISAVAFAPDSRRAVSGQLSDYTIHAGGCHVRFDLDR